MQPEGRVNHPTLVAVASIEPWPGHQRQRPGRSQGAVLVDVGVALFAGYDVVRVQWIWKVREDRLKLLEYRPVGGRVLLPFVRRLA